METKWMHDLLHECAKALMAEDQRQHKAGKIYVQVAARPTFTGRVICEAVAERLDVPEFGFLAYLLLAYAWNDALEWQALK